MKDILRSDKAPQHLSRESRRIWAELNREWKFEINDQLILRVALEAFDRLQVARKVLDAEGLTIENATNTGVVKIQKHPALDAEKNARSGFLQAMRMLGLEVEQPGAIGRPAGG